jgi:SMI1 / KNR4 family (SUKH-1)
MEFDLENVKFRLLEKRVFDVNRRMFGSGSHEYKSYPISRTEIVEFETKYKIDLPTSYKLFLEKIGCGAGPDYGLFNLQQIEDELFTLTELNADENVFLSPANPFPFTQSDIDNLNERIKQGEKSPFASTPLLENYFPCDGCLPISHQGCTYWTCLVVTGELKGTVWNAVCFEGFTGYWSPAKYTSISDGSYYQSISFEDWYLEWLDEATFGSRFFSNILDKSWNTIRNIFVKA